MEGGVNKRLDSVRGGVISLTRPRFDATKTLLGETGSRTFAGKTNFNELPVLLDINLRSNRGRNGTGGAHFGHSHANQHVGPSPDIQTRSPDAQSELEKYNIRVLGPGDWVWRNADPKEAPR